MKLTFLFLLFEYEIILFINIAKFITLTLKLNWLYKKKYLSQIKY